MSDLDDPRVRMAAERTLLAWIRTGLAVMALGFVLARHESPRALALTLGGGLIVAGSTVLALAARGYARFFGGIDPTDPAGRHLAGLAVWSAAALAIVGLVLAATLGILPGPTTPR